MNFKGSSGRIVVVGEEAVRNDTQSNKKNHLHNYSAEDLKIKRICKES